MAKGVKFEWDKSGYHALMRSDAGFKAVNHYAKQVAARANAMCSNGGKYTTSSHQGRKGRQVAIASVETADELTAIDNARNNTLVKARGGC